MEAWYLWKRAPDLRGCRPARGVHLGTSRPSPPVAKSTTRPYLTRPSAAQPPPLGACRTRPDAV
jgi:hypothetical protein